MRNLAAPAWLFAVGLLSGADDVWEPRKLELQLWMSRAQLPGEAH